MVKPKPIKPVPVAATDANSAELMRAFALHQEGQLEQAEAIYQAILRLQPLHLNATQLLATVAMQRRNFALAVELFDRAIALQPDFADAHYNRGKALADLQRAEAALESYDRALKLRPDYAEALSNRGSVLLRLKRLEDALESYERVLAIRPDLPEAHYNRGTALFALKRNQEAVASFAQALSLKPDYVEALNNCGTALLSLQLAAEALAHFDRALAIRPDHAEGLNNRGNALLDLHRATDALASFEAALKLRPAYVEALTNRGIALGELNCLDEALASYELALEINPQDATALFNRANTLRDRQRPEAALESYRRALQSRPGYADALNNLGNLLRALKRSEAALECYDRALLSEPSNAAAHYNRGIILSDLKRHEEALASYDRALEIKPDYAEAFNNRAATLRDLNRPEAALQSYSRALQIKPTLAFAYGNCLHAKMKLCDWRDVETQFAELGQRIARDETASPPFPVLAISSSRSLQKTAAGIWVREKAPASKALTAIPKPSRQNKIRIAYFSADLHKHATAFLMAELFERHDKSRFELTAFSFGPEQNDEMRARLAASFDRFVDVRNQPDKDVALLARSLGIDIAIDLKGFTQDGRAGIFAHRAAPLQVAYLGYPATMGAQYIDYLIADHTLIPESHRHDYTEKIAYLPHSYQVNDRQRRIADKQFTRAEFGLPDSGFVFCCFNNNYKILPATFDSWMRILRQVEHSVLWLFEGNATAADNLRKEAERRGVDASRLVFAQRMALAEHLARHRLADLFLDTLPCNAHTTASDALWAGLPLLTCLGETFAGRVAASLLAAIDLPELIAATPNAYESLAIRLAKHPDQLAKIKQKLVANRLTTPLFDTELFTRNLEALYIAMLERYQADLAPDHLELWTTPNAQQDFAAKLTTAIALHRQDQLVEAQALYEEILHSRPDHFDAMQLLAAITAQRGDAARGLELFDRALRIKPDAVHVLCNRGSALRDLGRYTEALETYHRAFELRPNDFEVLSNRARVLSKLYRFEAALQDYDHLLKLKPDDATALTSRGNVLLALKRHDEALENYRSALRIDPASTAAHKNIGAALVELKRPEEALASYDRALEIKPDDPETLNNRGNALLDLGRTDEAMASYDQALRLAPDYASAHYNRAALFLELKRYADAVASYDRALEIKPDYAEAFNNRGTALLDLQRIEEALESYASALKIKPDFADALRNRGNALRDLKRPKDALDSYALALKITPNAEFFYGTWLHAKMTLCDWNDLASDFDAITSRIERKEKVSSPFPVLAISNSRAVQKKAAEIWVQVKQPTGMTLGAILKQPRQGKLRIGYFSADFHNHATAYLMAELFERHDKSRFELTAFSFGPDQNDEMRARLAVSFDRFVDVRNKPDKDVALLARSLGIEIAVDLKGFTQNGRAGIFAHRAAPLQVAYLGYPGTMGAKYIDYLIADHTLIPESHRHDYTEKIAYLPHSYQVNDRQRRIADKVFTRAALGLPETGFVFCCFNNNYKILPATFDSWMRILKQVEHSVLWLLEDNAAAAENLRREAERRGADPSRLVFARRLPAAEHLARQGLADLFLDTLPYNAHTTASDALWAGLPVLTCLGETFAGRVAASLLNAIDLPELIALTPMAYESLAVELALNPDQLAKIKQKLVANRLTTPLFDTEFFTRDLEAIYTAMLDRYQADLAPDHLDLWATPNVRQGVAAMLTRAIAMHRQGKLVEAQAMYEAVLAQQPEHVEAMQFLATLVGQRGDLTQAVTLFDRALRIKPDYAQALNNRGNTLRELKRFDEALTSYDRALMIKPDYLQAMYNRGNALRDLKRTGEALASYDQALAIKPDYVEALYSRGLALCDLERSDEAISCYDLALRHKPDYLEVHYHRGTVLFRLNRLNAALESYDRAIQIKPDYAEALLNRAMCRLGLGDLKAAWPDYEHRDNPQIKARATIPPPYPIERWQAQSLSGKSILIWKEQGLGDQIMFCRYLAQVKALGARQVTLVCSKVLKSLFTGLAGVDVIADETGPLPPCDYWTYLISLPYHFATDETTIPAGVPYLSAQPEQVTALDAIVAAHAGLRIGLCWAGAKAFPNDAQRSPGLKPFQPLLKIAGVCFYTLLPGTRREFLNMTGAAGVDLGHEIDEGTPAFAETAALMHHLDLIITSDTSIAHLAGALGKPTWLLLSNSAYWTWMREREDSPWYPSMRLFRQATPGDWTNVFERLADALRLLIDNTASPTN